MKKASRYKVGFFPLITNLKKDSFVSFLRRRVIQNVKKTNWKKNVLGHVSQKKCFNSSSTLCIITLFVSFTFDFYFFPICRFFVSLDQKSMKRWFFLYRDHKFDVKRVLLNNKLVLTNIKRDLQTIKRVL